MRRRREPMSVARQLLILQTVALAVVVLVAGVLFAVDERRDADSATRRSVTDVAATTALDPEVAAGIVGPDPTAALQPRAEAVRIATGVDFVVIMGLDEIRLTHPLPEQIGRPYTGHTEPARAGRTFTETYTGSLGPSIRAVAPVYDPGGTLVGFVSVGVTRQKTWEQFRTGLPALLGIVAIGLLVSTTGVYLISRRLRRQTLGLAPDQLRRMYEHHDAVLHAIGEGLLVFGTDGSGRPRVDVVNDQARRLLGLPADGPVPFDTLPETLRSLATDEGDGDTPDEVHVTADRVLVVGRAPLHWEGRRIGTVVTLRDRTELRSALGELDSVRGLAESLRAQAHESANRLHTIVTMVELGRPEEAIAFATEELRVSQGLVDRLTTTVADPALSALLIGKVASAAERGVELTVTDDTALGATPLRSRDLVTLVGNLVDNAIDAARGGDVEAARGSDVEADHGGDTGAARGEDTDADHGGDTGAARGGDERWVEVSVREEGSTMLVEVADSGPGMAPETLSRAMTRGWSTKAEHSGLGLALVAQVVARYGGTLRTEPSLGSLIVAEIPLERPARPGNTGGAG